MPVQVDIQSHASRLLDSRLPCTGNDARAQWNFEATPPTPSPGPSIISEPCRRIPWKFDKWQARLTIPSLDHDLIRAYSLRSLEPFTGPERYVIILIDPIPAHPYSPHQLSVFVQRNTARKNLGAALQARDPRIAASCPREWRYDPLG